VAAPDDAYGESYRASDHRYAAVGASAALDAEWREAYRVLADTEQEWSELHPRFGPNGQWDAHRRALRGVIGTQIRATCREKGEKVTEAELEDAACADERYGAYLSEAEDGAARYAVLTSQRALAKEMMEWARTRAYLHGAEARLTPTGGV
jgi:hypothetical protein